MCGGSCPSSITGGIVPLAELSLSDLGGIDSWEDSIVGDGLACLESFVGVGFNSALFSLLFVWLLVETYAGEVELLSLWPEPFLGETRPVYSLVLASFFCCNTC